MQAISCLFATLVSIHPSQRTLKVTQPAIYF
jgi:hypothetical protein